MKVNLDKDYKTMYTVAEVTEAKKIINQMKEDESSAADMAEYAIREALKDKNDYLREVLKATATITKNYRAWNNYNENSGQLDVWVEATAETEKGFVKVGACLTDIWQTGATDYSNFMYVQYFKEVKRS